MFAYDKIAVTDQERGDIVAFARQMAMDLGSSRPGPQKNRDGLTSPAIRVEVPWPPPSVAL